MREVISACLPITALDANDCVLLVASGHTLLVHDRDTLAQISRFTHFHYAIGGVAFKSHNEACVWSRGTLLTVKFNANFTHCEIVTTCNYNDTILDVVDNVVLFRQNTINLKVPYPPQKLLYSGRIAHNFIVAGTIQNDVELWSIESGDVLGVGTGHRGSIFAVLVDGKTLFTGSDDRSIRIWQVDQLQNGKTSEQCALWGHQGRIWSLVKVNHWLVSGGEDGIFIWNIETQEKVKFIATRSPVWNLAKTANQLIFAGCQNGALLRLDIQLETAQNHVETIGEDKEIKFGAVFRLHQSDLILFGEEPDKMVSVFRYNMALKKMVKSGLTINRYYRATPSRDKETILVHDAKVNRFYVITRSDRVSGNLGQIAARSITSLGLSGDWLVYTDDELAYRVTFEQSTITARLLSNKKLTLPPGRHRWVTYSRRFGSEGIICGTASGHVVYWPHLDSAYSSSTSVHGKHGVTFITVDDQKDIVLTTGRNGLIAMWTVESLKTGVPLRTTRSGLEWPIEIDNELIIGFQADKFKMIKKGHVIFRSRCGGGHRSCDFWLNDNSEAFLAYVKKGVVMLERGSVRDKRATMGTGHTGHINAAVAIGGSGFATCGEDTRVVVHRQDDTKVIFDVHDTSQRALAYCDGLLASGGGKEVISVHCVETGALIGLYDPHVEKYHSKKESVQNKRRKMELSKTSDCRIMDLCFLSNMKLVSLTSNGQCHLFDVKPTSGIARSSTILVSEHHCLTRVIFDHGFLYIVDTGGWLYKYTADCELMFKRRVDTAGLNALVVGNGFIFTGGDSGWLFRIENDQWDRVEKAHISTCGLTALKLRDGKLVTLSIDQRVLLFDMSLTLIKGAMTQVTDGAALVPVDNDRLIIAGDGLEEMDF